MNLVILGASGSIGKQTIEVVKKEKKWDLVGISVGNNVKYALNLLKEFPSIKYLSILNKNDLNYFNNLNREIKIFTGSEGILDLINTSEAEIYVNALAGFSGVLPSIKIIEKEKKLCLANKETIVCLGELYSEILGKHKKAIVVPIDSEHAGLKKCIGKFKDSEISEYIITASGGPFFDLNKDDFKKIELKDALNHPNWKMGNKITIDSSCMINKAFEIIEAHYLFNIPINKIKVLVDRKSYVHALVKLKDGTYRVNYGPKIPTMTRPISFALNYKKDRNFYTDVKKYSDLERFSFKILDKNKFPLIKYGEFVLNKKGNSGVVFNAISEECVNSFIQGKIKYVDIEQIVDKIMNSFDFEYDLSINKIIDSDKKARLRAQKLISNERR